jgi:1,4-alpha-glucan branching enzyme
MRVTFELPADIAEESVAVVGDFNDWDETADRMNLMPRNGVWRTKISVTPGGTYEFRYLLDGETWMNEEDADGYASNPYFEDNSVLEA